jgi:formate/nitrite transporter FocA (FNT family)
MCFKRVGGVWPSEVRAFIEELAPGIMCNDLVCVAVWLRMNGRTAMDRIVAIPMAKTPI